jgi:hypothetical protein
MAWYAAHAIMSVKFTDGNQDKYPIWENIILIKADSDAEALEKAKKRAKQDESSSIPDFTWKGRSASWVFAGIRKLIACVDSESRPKDGTEITYSEMELDTAEDLFKLVNGQPVTISYQE